MCGDSYTLSRPQPAEVSLAWKSFHPIFTPIWFKHNHFRFGQAVHTVWNGTKAPPVMKSPQATT
jgi:hypothetical protein